MCKGRFRLTGRKLFACLTTEELLVELEAYVYMTYYIGNLPIIYVRGDGGGWICNALDEAFMHVIHVHDAYHWMKVVRSVSRLFPRSGVPERVRKAVENDDSNAFEKIIKGLKKNAQPDKTKLDVVEKMEKYYTNHWDAIRYSLDENTPAPVRSRQCSICWLPARRPFLPAGR